MLMLMERLCCCCYCFCQVTNGRHPAVDHHADKLLFDELQHALDVCDFSPEVKKVGITLRYSFTFTLSHLCCSVRTPLAKLPSRLDGEKRKTKERKKHQQQNVMAVSQLAGGRP